MRNVCALALFAGGICLAGMARAEGGYYSGNLGARASGRGGAFTARADDVTAVSYNPAGLAGLDGTRIQVGNAFSYNASTFARATTRDWGDRDDPGRTVTFPRVENQKPWQVLDPLIGVASNLGLSGWGFALAAYAPPGISNEQFPASGGQRYMMVSRESQILNYTASLAWRLRDVFGLGASLQWITLRRLNYSLVIDGTVTSGAANPVRSNEDILANVSASSLFTLNAVVGAWYRPAPFLEVGLSGQVVPTNIKADGHLSIASLGALEDLSLRAANGGKGDGVTITLPLPMLFRAGARYRHLDGTREIFDIELDLEYETWSRVNRFVVDTHGLRVNEGGTTIPIGTINIDKQWRDTIAVKLGGDYAVIPDRLTLRAGGYYETAVAKPAYMHVDFPGGPQLGGALGTSVFLGPVELALVYQLRYQPTVTISEASARVYQTVPASLCKAPYTTDCNEHYQGQPAPAVNAGTFTASSHIVAFDLLYKF